jgi:hypothetical protein
VHDPHTRPCTVAALHRATIRATMMGRPTDAERMAALRCARRRTEALERLKRDTASRIGIG